MDDRKPSSRTIIYISEWNMILFIHLHDQEIVVIFNVNQNPSLFGFISWYIKSLSPNSACKLHHQALCVFPTSSPLLTLLQFSSAVELSLVLHKLGIFQCWAPLCTILLAHNVILPLMAWLEL